MKPMDYAIGLLVVLLAVSIWLNVSQAQTERVVCSTYALGNGTIAQVCLGEGWRRVCNTYPDGTTRCMTSPR